MINWFKTHVWGALVAVGGAVLLALAASRAQRKRHAADSMEKRAQDMLSQNTSKHIKESKKLMEKAHKEKDKAIKARAKAEKQLEKLGEANEDLDTIADRFNSRRVRK